MSALGRLNLVHVPSCCLSRDLSLCPGGGSGPQAHSRCSLRVSHLSPSLSPESFGASANAHRALLALHCHRERSADPALCQDRATLAVRADTVSCRPTVRAGPSLGTVPATAGFQGVGACRRVCRLTAGSWPGLELTFPSRLLEKSRSFLRLAGPRDSGPSAPCRCVRVSCGFHVISCWPGCATWCAQLGPMGTPGPGCQGEGSLSPHLTVTSLRGLHLYHSAPKNHTHTATGEEYLTFLTKKKNLNHEKKKIKAYTLF